MAATCDNSRPTGLGEIDVAAEMRRIRDEVRRKYRSHLDPYAQGQHEAAWQGLREGLAEVRERWHVREVPFESQAPVVGPLVAAFRTAWNNVAARWHVWHILEQQNAFNQAMYRLVDGLCQELEVQAILNTRLGRLLSTYFRQAEPADGTISAGGAGAATFSEGELDFDSLCFNTRYGGGDTSHEEYRQYVPLFVGLGPVLDAGCGQGGFLALLEEAGVAAYGVDREPEMVEACSLKGLSAQCADVLDHLAGLGAGALGGVFCGHLLEHLPLTDLRRFLDLAYAGLSPGGLLVAETPNVRSLFVLANTYFRDPTHQRPLHPETYLFLAESAGFETHLRYSLPVPSDVALEPLSDEEASATDAATIMALNERLQRLGQQVYGFQNVALIARKPLDEA